MIISSIDKNKEIKKEESDINQSSSDEDESQMSEEQKEKCKKNSWLGIQIKHQYGFRQWLTIIVMSSTMVTIGVYMNT